MSLAIDLTRCHERLALAAANASCEARKLKASAAAEVYEELMLQLCVFAAEVNQLKVLLGALRMTGELEQRPPAVRAETLELYEGRTRVVPPFPAHPLKDESEAFKRELVAIGDDTFAGDDDGNVSVNLKEVDHG